MNILEIKEGGNMSEGKFSPPRVQILHIIISYPDAGLGHCPEGQGPDIKNKF